MQSYRDFDPEELAADPLFQRWKLQNDPEASTFWTEWLRQNPDRQTLVATATALLTAIDQHYAESVDKLIPLSDQEIGLEMSRLRQSLKVRQQPFRWIQYAPVRYAAAASVLLLLGFFGWYWLRSTPARPAVTYEELVARQPDPLEEIVNTEGKAMLVTLPDRSTILVYPKSRISYPKQFAGAKREVFLQGKAFFNVTKDPSKPFFVYANNLITRVLGTSFNIQTNELNRQVKVVVRTGRVSVYAADKPAPNRKADSSGSGVVLTPNQQLVFSATDSRLTKSLVAEPVILPQIESQAGFRFHRTPIADVFATLEKAYGVRIEYNAALMQNCYLTASLTNEPFMEKLDLICRTVNADYQQVDGNIVVHAQGCD
ncbi:FecR family protein [Spirosoma montaniterrae]|uniref:Iron dicitrate transport regulator FecR n=1 Tax=Spirosoma montaniterrae TaxID=1178516 RepID=A0A1P9WWW6_9BACT|nr:FecR family protein [Spirosoma montaniterrae]AQG79833.1 iron dicitrate transport regulator FecR [Spirosoma montaniterrae]